jgi:hypothetical protein
METEENPKGIEKNTTSIKYTNLMSNTLMPNGCFYIIKKISLSHFSLVGVIK